MIFHIIERKPFESTTKTLVLLWGNSIQGANMPWFGRKTAHKSLNSIKCNGSPRKQLFEISHTWTCFDADSLLHFSEHNDLAAVCHPYQGILASFRIFSSTGSKGFVAFSNSFLPIMCNVATCCAVRSSTFHLYTKFQCFICFKTKTHGYTSREHKILHRIGTCLTLVSLPID